LLLLFAFYNVQPDLDRKLFRETEAGIAEAYRRGCRSYGWENLGTYACEAHPAASWPFDHVHPYVIDADDTAAALRMAEAPGPPGLSDVVEIGRSLMTGQDDTAVVWFRPDHGQPNQPTALGERRLVVSLGSEAESLRHVAHPGSLGRFQVEGHATARTGEVCVHHPADLGDLALDHGWLLTPVVAGAESVPLLTASSDPR
jgi:hypothetical protein